MYYNFERLKEKMAKLHGRYSWGNKDADEYVNYGVYMLKDLGELGGAIADNDPDLPDDAEFIIKIKKK